MLGSNRRKTQEPIESSTIPVATVARLIFHSALPAHIARPIPQRPSQFSNPAFSAAHFSGTLLQANSCGRLPNELFVSLNIRDNVTIHFFLGILIYGLFAAQ
jgi:hypothetical protein